MKEPDAAAEPSVGIVLIERLLDWPFLFFVLIVVGAYLGRHHVTKIADRVSEFALGKDGLSFKIGADEVSIERLDTAITARLRDLQEEIEELRSKSSSASSAALDEVARAHDSAAGDEIPPGLETAIENVIYPMLASKLWVGRYVDTLAKAAAVSEETMLKFCKSRTDIGLYKDGSRWVAALTERLKPDH
jgi:hypothetical protein